MITIARLTVREAARRRIVWVLVLLTVASVAATGWGIERLATLARQDGVTEFQVRLGVSQLLIVVAFMFSFVLAMTAAFLGASAIAADLESGVALAILARPIRRADLVVGRWLGLALVVVGYAAASGLLEIAVVAVATGHTPPDPWSAVAFLAFEGVVVLTLSLALGTRLPPVAGGAVAVVAFGLTWMAGVFAGVARVLGIDVLASVAQASRFLLPTDGLWRGVVFGLEPPAVLLGSGTIGPAAEANPFFAASPPSPGFVVWSIAWVLAVLAVAAWSLERREL